MCFFFVAFKKNTIYAYLKLLFVGVEFCFVCLVVVVFFVVFFCFFVCFFLGGGGFVWFFVELGIWFFCCLFVVVFFGGLGGCLL